MVSPIDTNRPSYHDKGEGSRVSPSNRSAFSVDNQSVPVPVSPNQPSKDSHRGGGQDAHKKSIDARLQATSVPAKKSSPLPSGMEAARRKLFKELEEKEKQKKKRDEEQPEQDEKGEES